MKHHLVLSLGRKTPWAGLGICLRLVLLGDFLPGKALEYVHHNIATSSCARYFQTL